MKGILTVKRQHFTYGLVAVFAVLALFAVAGHPIIPPEALASIGMAPMALSGEVSLVEVKQLLESQGKAFDEFKKANDELVKAKADGKAVSDLEAKVSALSGAVDKFDEAKAAIEEIQKKLNRPSNDVDAKDAAALKLEVKGFNLQRKSVAAAAGKVADGMVGEEQYVAYKSAFLKLAAQGTGPLTADEVKALQSGVDSDGGYLLPASTVGRTIKKLYETSPMREIATVQDISTEAIEGINDNDEAAAGWVGETGSRNETNTPGVGKWRIEAHEMFAAPKATQKFLDDAAVDVEAWLADKVSDKFSRVENNAFIVGNGIAKPRGIAMYDTAAQADDARAWGTLEHVATGSAGAFPGSNPADVLISLMGALKEGYKEGARWMTRREVITLIRKFKDGQGQYLWQPSLVMGQPNKIMDYPVTVAMDMPALASGSLSLAFGNFKEGYQIVDRVGIRTLRDPYTNKPYVIFYSTKRTGGGVLNFEAIKFLKFS